MDYSRLERAHHGDLVSSNCSSLRQKINMSKSGPELHFFPYGHGFVGCERMGLKMTSVSWWTPVTYWLSECPVSSGSLGKRSTFCVHLSTISNQPTQPHSEHQVFILSNKKTMEKINDLIRNISLMPYRKKIMENINDLIRNILFISYRKKTMEEINNRSSASTKLGLLDLPTELRLKIYDFASRCHTSHAIPDEVEMILYAKDRDCTSLVNLSATCGQLHTEVDDFRLWNAAIRDPIKQLLQLFCPTTSPRNALQGHYSFPSLSGYWRFTFTQVSFSSPRVRGLRSYSLCCVHLWTCKHLKSGFVFRGWTRARLEEIASEICGVRRTAEAEGRVEGTSQKDIEVDFGFKFVDWLNRFRWLEWDRAAGRGGV